MAQLIIALVCALLGLSAYGLLSRRLYRVAREPHELIRFQARDGFCLGMAHYRASGEPIRDPVVLCHGVGANHHHLDFDEETSLARYLARQGFPVYLLDLRGRGLSRGAGWIPRQRFDEFVQCDLPAVIDAVQARHEGAHVHWVGHSMGGQALYAFLGTSPQAPVRSAVTIGAPVRLLLPRPLYLLARLATALRLRIPLFAESLSALSAPFAARWIRFPERLTLHPENTKPLRVRQALVDVASTLSSGEVAHFCRMAVEGSFRSADGVDYAAALPDISTPILVLAGSSDRLAVPAGVRHGFELLGGPSEFRVFGRENGDPADFGHVDLLIGDCAPSVVFPEVAAWLIRHDGGA